MIDMAASHDPILNKNSICIIKKAPIAGGIIC